MENNKQVVEEKQAVVYVVNKAAIAKMGDIYLHLTIDDLDDKEQFDAVHSARMVMVKHRARVDRHRVERNQDANAWIRDNNRDAAALVALMAPIEAHLKAQEAPVIEKEKRVKAEKEEAQRKLTQNRVEQLQAVGLSVGFDQAGSYTVNDFLVLLETETKRVEAEKERLAKEAADRKAEDDRLERVAKEQEAIAEKLRIAQKKIDDEKAAIEAEKAEIAAEKIRLAQKKIDDEKAKLKADKKAESDRKQAAEKAEVEKFLADEKAEADAKRKEQEAIDKKKAFEELKKRQEALRPDKEKLKKFGHELLEIRGPELSDTDLKAYLEGALDKIHNLADNMIDDFDL